MNVKEIAHGLETDWTPTKKTVFRKLLFKFTRLRLQEVLD